MKKIFILFLPFLLSACSENIFDEIADKDTEEAIYFEARQEINKRNYGTAIGLFEQLSAEFLADRDRIPIHASAYTGRCGLEFLTLLNNLQNAGSATIFGTLMVGFPGADAQAVADCIQAETIVEAIGDETARSGDENLFMAFSAFAKIGTILSSLADTDDDGTADAGFDQCNVTNLPETMVRELGASLAVALLSLTAVGTSYVDDSLADVNALCGLDANLAVFCNTTDPNAFTGVQVQAMRYAIGSNDVGINSCGNRDFTNCAAANPACP